MMLELEFHHFGLAARDPEPSRKMLRTLGYEVGEPVFDGNQHSYVQMCRSERLPDVEIIYSDDPQSPLNTILKNQEESVYHICYRTRSIEEAVRDIRQSGQRVMPVAAACPAPLFGNRPVAFYYVRGLGLVEFLEEPR
jgi:Glyoxalase/Bleomycin resistance protein/Dioxygenase superfamily